MGFRRSQRTSIAFEYIYAHTVLTIAIKVTSSNILNSYNIKNALWLSNLFNFFLLLSPFIHTVYMRCAGCSKMLRKLHTRFICIGNKMKKIAQPNLRSVPMYSRVCVCVCRTGEWHHRIGCHKIEREKPSNALCKYERYYCYCCGCGCSHCLAHFPSFVTQKFPNKTKTKTNIYMRTTNDFAECKCWSKNCHKKQSICVLIFTNNSQFFFW